LTKLEYFANNGRMLGISLIKNFKQLGLMAFAIMPLMMRAQTGPVQFVSLGDLNTQHVSKEAVGPGATVANQAYFASSDSEHGAEIWRYNGGIAALFRDTRPGPESSNPSQFTVVDNSVVYVADDGVHGPELYTTADISASGLLADVQPGGTHAAPTILGASNGWLWFTTSSTSDNLGPATELWVTNGTSPPTRKGYYAEDSISHVTVLGTRATLLFLARPFGSPPGYLDFMRGEGSRTPIQIDRLRTNPNTPVPTTPIYAATTDFVCYQRIDSNAEPMLAPFSGGSPGVLVTIASGNSKPGHFVSNETDTVCFTAAAPSDYRDVWITHGSAATTSMLVDVPNAANTTPSRLTMSRGNPGVFFQVGSESSVRDLYFADPTATPVSIKYDSQVQNTLQHTIVGSKEIAYIKPESSFWQVKLGNGVNDYAVNLGPVFNSVARMWNASTTSPMGSSLFVVGTTSSNGEELYRRSGANLQSLFLANAPPGDSAKPRNFFPFGINDQLFVANTSSEQGRLYRMSSSSNPIPITLDIPDDTYPYNASSLPDNFTEASNFLFFTAYDGTNRRLFHSPDGQPNSTSVVAGVYDPEQLVVYQGHLFLLGRATAGGSGAKQVFRVDLNSGVDSAWRFDQSDHDTAVLKAAAGCLFFAEPGAGNTELLQCIRPNLSLQTLYTFDKDASGIGITQLTASSGHLYFTAKQYNNPNAPRVIWSTDGISHSISLAPTDVAPNLLGAVGDICLFWLEATEDTPYRLYSWDSVAGSPVYCSGTNFDDEPEKRGANDEPRGVELDGWFYFASKVGSLLRTNGLSSQRLYLSSSYKVRHRSIAALTDKIVFNTERNNQTLFHRFSPSDTSLSTFWWAPDDSLPSPFVVLDGKLYFTTQRLSSSYYFGRTSLYRTDGTTEGTELLTSELARRNIAGGPMGVYRGHLVLAPALYNGFQGLEPALLNHTPVIPSFTPLTGGLRNQTFHFTYDQMVGSPPTDPDGDPLSPLVFYLGEGTIKINDVSVSFSAEISPGDEFDWTPPEGRSGSLHIGSLSVTDGWLPDAWEPIYLEVKTPHNLWTESHFTPEELEDYRVSAPESDANGNGIPNAFEFIFARDPKSPDTTPGWSPSMATPPGGGPSVRRFTFTRAAVLPEGTVLKVQCSPDLAPLSWATIATKMENTPWDTTATLNEETQPDGRVEVRVDLPAGGTCTFFRLSVDL
jgi:ELWxxDGT repeat protein